ncbi:DUF1573 domain-containing protein [bacterium]|nr:DUF1573 domain-containing protein [bacterium]
MKKVIGSFYLYLIFSNISMAQHVQFLTSQIIDFGTVKEDTVLQGNILFVNSSDEPVTIKNVRTSCGCTVAQVTKRKCAPGDTLNVPFSFNTKGYEGLVRKTITILFQEDDTNDTSFVIQANIFQEIEILPNHFQFAINQSNSDSIISDIFTIKNYMKNPLQIHKIHAANNIITATPISAVIQPGEAKQIKIQFNVSQIQQKYITLTIDTDYNRNPQIFLPILIDIKD